ncbi:MAG: DoxX family protein [Chloroflexi bacterium]|nr:MAG: DoxX family protein [Chloroflexota bacterium]
MARVLPQRKECKEGSSMTFVTPVISTDVAFALVRVVVGLVVAAHGAQKVFGVWGGPGIEGWKAGMTRMGMRPPTFWGYVSAHTELAGGIALALGLLIPVVAALVTMQMAVAIQRAHWAKGFFNTKGGIEFPLTLAAVAAANGIAEPGIYSLDRALGLPAFGAGAYVVVLLVAWLAYFAGSRTPRAEQASATKAA